MDFKSARFYTNKTQLQIERDTGVFASRISRYEKYGIQLRDDEKRKIEKYLKVEIHWDRTGVPKMPTMNFDRK